MNFAEVYPEPARLIENEQTTLKFLMDSAFILEKYPELARDARNAFFKNAADRSFSFESHIDVSHDGYRRRVFVGGLLSLDATGCYDDVSYYLMICRDIVIPSYVLRKFHFDVALPGKSRRRLHPLFHLQYCGKLSPRLTGLGFSIEHLEKWLSEPRLWYTPVSVALLLHCLFREFRDEVSHKLSQRKEWLELVKANENLVLRPYFQNSFEFFSNKEKKTKLFMDFLYGVEEPCLPASHIG